MARKTSVGKCEKCGQVFSKTAMGRHIEKCVREKSAAESDGKGAAGAKAFHLLVEGRGAPEYWLHLDVPASATLKTLDAFLRNIWLECCGHLSQFEIKGKRYSVDPDPSFGDRSMAFALDKVLEPGMKFRHEYDFGTTTELDLKVISLHDGAAGGKGKGVRLLARNEPPEIPCCGCSKPAVVVCAQCVWDDEGWLCDDCSKQHDCDEDMFLPVVNSPRVGMCGYGG